MDKRRWRNPAVVVVVVLAALVVRSSPVDAGEGHRYLDPVFEEVAVTHDVLYRSTVDYKGDPIDLHLDIYEPVGDVAGARPVMMYMHGGGFTGGNKAGGRSSELSTAYAQRGFVVVSISYRVNPTTSGGLEDISDPEFLGAILDAWSDATAAVAWLRWNAAALRIDPDAISASGYSAGAVLALMLAYSPDITAPDAGTHPSRISAAVSIAGTMLPQLVQPGEPPAYMAHGELDTRVPYASAVELCAALGAAGVPCEFLTMAATAHDPSAFHDQIVEESSAFVFALVLAPLGYTTEIAPLVPPAPHDPAPASPFVAAVPSAPAAPAATAGRGVRPRFTG